VIGERREEIDMVRRFCAKCGDPLTATTVATLGDPDLGEVSGSPAAAVLCRTCAGQHDVRIFFPHKISLLECSDCGDFSVAVDNEVGKWVPFDPLEEEKLDFVTRLFFERLLYKLEAQHKVEFSVFLRAEELEVDTANRVNLVVHAKSPQGQVVDEQQLMVNHKVRCCPACAKKRGGRFDAILQLRLIHPRSTQLLEAAKSVLEAEANRANARNREAFISKVEPVPNGYDFKLSTKYLTKHLTGTLLRAYPAIVKVSTKLMGINQETGGELNRLYLLVKLLPVEVGDDVETGGITYRVRKFVKNGVLLQAPGGRQVIQKFPFFEHIDEYKITERPSVEDETEQWSDESGTLR
jgi:NMD protein affecting ribosome stability and mRNA decay